MTNDATVAGPLSSLALAMLACMLDAGDRSPEAEFLRAQQKAAPAPEQAAAALDRYLADPAPADRLLLKLAQELGLERVEILAVALAAAVETGLMCGRAIAHLQAPIGGSRPTLGLLAAAFAALAVDDRNVIPAILSGAAVESGLLQIGSEGSPLAERPLSMPVPVCLALDCASAEGYDAPWPGAAIAAGNAPEVPLPPSVVSAAKKQAQALLAGVQRALAIRSGSFAEARTVAAHIARLTGRRAVFIDPERARSSTALPGLAPWLFLRQLLPVFAVDLGPGERRTLPAIPRYHGPVLALCGPEGSLDLAGAAVPDWKLGVALKSERTALWEKAIGNRALAQELAGHRHGSGRIAQLGRLARFQGLTEGRPRPRMQDVVSASWTVEGAGLEALAQPLPDLIPEDALVMTPVLRADLNRLLLRCRGREGLVEGLGASAVAKYRPGVRALFTGQSGTGKTLAAGWLATRLALPLYRVDLAAVTSKYIGETEKNLAQLLARAEHAEVILLFDEADSMFGKRTDVKESNDRFANAQTNYLLQRIETFDGIVFLTSNNRARFDPAFFRRLDAIIDFPVPGPEDRRSLWQSHLGAEHSVSPREINLLAASADLFGGNIRNAVLTASLLARAESRRIAYTDILQSLADEYRKLGRQAPAELQKGA